jgi:hypothetical protein
MQEVPSRALASVRRVMKAARRRLVEDVNVEPIFAICAMMFFELFCDLE